MAEDDNDSKMLIKPSQEFYVISPFICIFSFLEELEWRVVGAGSLFIIIIITIIVITVVIILSSEILK